MGDLKAQRIFVTGAGGGLGRGLAVAFARQSARLGLADVSEAGLAATEVSLRAVGNHPWTGRLDVRDADAVHTAVASFAAEAGGLDVVVNAAGVLSVAHVVDLDPAEWRRVLDINATGTFLVAQAAARIMIERRMEGSIVNVASISGKVGDAGLAHYSASKFAVVGFTQSLARELVQHGITVNAVCPGTVDTPMIEDLAKGWGVTIEQFLALQAIKRPQTPDEIADAIAFLHGCRAVTGQAINVDGGTYFH